MKEQKGNKFALVGVWGVVIASLLISYLLNIIPFIDFVFICMFFIILITSQSIFFSLQYSIGYKSNMVPPQENKTPCLLEKYCCVDAYLSQIKKTDTANIVVTNGFLNKYNLTNEDNIVEKFRTFYEPGVDKEIWIFSYDLNSEALGGNLQNAATENINKGIKYIYFYIGRFENQIIIEENKEKILNKVRRHKNNVVFVPINEENTTINILPELLGSITFYEKQDNHIKFDSYFSLRGFAEPIYFRMPRCMNEAYYRYFASLIKRQLEEEVS